MSPTSFHLVIWLDHARTRSVELKNVSPGETVAAVIREVLRRLGRPPEAAGWSLAYRGTALPPQADLRSSLPATHERLELFLQLEEEGASQVVAVELKEEVVTGQIRAAPAAPCPPPSARAAPPPDTGQFRAPGAPPICDEEFEELGESLDEELVCESAALEEEEAEEECAAVSASPAKKAVTRRATVRHYSRMNPDRVYPLLVLITRDMVEKVQKKGTSQKSSGPFQVDTDAPVEVEPLLPGCDCYPPKIVTRLGKGDLSLTFRVVPHVLGEVDGAAVSIRQDHASLAEVKLDVRVVQRKWVVLSGLLTFLLPALSAVLKHFGLDFDTQKEQGFNLYLAGASMVFDRVSPLALTAALGLGTALLWWLTRPRMRDVFWDIETVGPAEKLRRIAAAMTTDPQRAAGELMELLKAYPDHKPTRLFYADWHYQTGDHEAALKGYTRAFKLGVAGAAHYLRASLAASQTGQNERALEILEEAARVLPAGQFSGVMHFNMACYHVRLGDPDRAMACLKRAVAAGYTKQESYLKDPDLKPLRSRPDFKQLVAALTKTARG